MIINILDKLEDGAATIKGPKLFIRLEVKSVCCEMLTTRREVPVVGGEEEILKATEVGTFSAQVENPALDRTNSCFTVATKIRNIDEGDPEAHGRKGALESRKLF